MDIKRAICHEAGHATTALHLGFCVQKIALCHGRLNTLTDMDSPAQTPLNQHIVLAGGIAGEKMCLADSEYDQDGAVSDQREISRRGGGNIGLYLQPASDIIRSNRTRFCELQKRLSLRWLKARAEAQWGSDPNSFELLSQEEIQEIWTSHAL